MKWQTKLHYYQQLVNGYYRADDLDLPVGLERALCRNEAWRTGNRQLYHNFLLQCGSENVREELESFDQTAANLILMEQRHIQYIMRNCRINMLQADIWMDDEDCIFKLLDVAEQDVLVHLDQTLRSVIAVNLLPQEIAGYPCAWVDISAFSARIDANVLSQYAARLAS